VASARFQARGVPREKRRGGDGPGPRLQGQGRQRACPGPAGPARQPVRL